MRRHDGRRRSPRRTADVGRRLPDAPRPPLPDAARRLRAGVSGPPRGDPGRSHRRRRGLGRRQSRRGARRAGEGRRAAAPGGGRPGDARGRPHRVRRLVLHQPRDRLDPRAAHAGQRALRRRPRPRPPVPVAVVRRPHRLPAHDPHHRHPRPLPLEHRPHAPRPAPCRRRGRAARAGGRPPRWVPRHGARGRGDRGGGPPLHRSLVPAPRDLSHGRAADGPASTSRRSVRS